MTEINFRNQKNGLTREQKEFIIKNYSTMNSSRICNMIGVTYKSLHGYANNLHLTKNDFDYYYNIRKSKTDYSYLRYTNKLKENKVTDLYRSKYGKYESNQNYFSKIDNEFKSYWLGFLYADCYNNTNEGNVEITLCKEDELHISKFLDSIQSDAPIKQKVVRNFLACRVNVCNRKISDDLNNLGCIKNKSLALSFPTQEIIPKELMRHFIRGFFDGDGCIHIDIDKKECSVGFTSNYNFCLSLRDYLSDKLYISKVTINEDKRSSACQICWNGAENSNKIFQYLYKDSNIYLDRKINKFDMIFCLD